MAITEESFTDEAELERWVRANIDAFYPGSLLLPGKQILTSSGKGGVPDGFLFDLSDHQWYVIEAELLRHNVWPHIAEQIVRFVVATQNPTTRRTIRDHLFESVMERNLANHVCQLLETTPERLLQEIELFIEGTEPQIIIFIDDTNQDLTDVVNALSVDTFVYRVKKYLVNGHAEYSSPDNRRPQIVAEAVASSASATGEYDVIEILGGGELVTTAGRFKCYKMQDRSILHIKRSKYYPRHDSYWYGVTPAELQACTDFGVTHVVFVMADHGMVRVPLEIVERFIKITHSSKNPDGTIRHYHCFISPPPEPDLFYSEQVPKFELAQYYQAF